jgi:hypothetical protein
MKPKTMIQLVMMLCVITPLGALAQFSSGSTGADGPLVVTNDLTLNLPTNGIFNFTTITVSNGATLRFNRNLLNTPVYLLATGDVVIGGTIDVSGENSSGANPGKSGPGGFDGGFGMFFGFPSGDGQGPGGGRLKSVTAELAGVYAFGNSANTNIYGNTLLSPLVGGSGGGARSDANGGGGGGGSMLIASSTKVTLNGGVVSAGGQANGGGGGSGGAIRIVAPMVNGVGSLRVPGGASTQSSSANGLPGRTRIDSLDRFAWRTLSLVQAGKFTSGTQMFVFPPGNPHLDIINAAGTPIIEGTNAPVIVYLPVGSSSNQLVRVQARGFTNDVPIRVKITPENAPSATFDGTIQQVSGNPPFADVQVTLPVDTVCHVHAWTR